MVNITLQFTVFQADGAPRFVSSSALTHLFCNAHGFDYALQKDIDQLVEKGYTVIIEEEEPQYLPARD